jgi:hypothetical protein
LRDKTSKKRPFGKEWECWGCGEKGHHTSKDDKERIVKKRSFSKKELAVLTDPQFEGKDLAVLDEKVWFPYIPDSGAFTTVVPKSLLKKLKEAGSGVVGSTLEKRCGNEDGSERCCDYREVNDTYHCSTYHKSWSCEDEKFEGSGCPGRDGRHAHRRRSLEMPRYRSTRDIGCSTGKRGIGG